MIDAYKLYRDTLDIINKEQNGFLTSELFNRLSDAASLKFFNDLFETTQSAVSANDSKNIAKEHLLPFRELLLIYPKNGFFVVPDDYAYKASIRASYYNPDAAKRLFELNAQLCSAESDPTVNKEDLRQEIENILSSDAFVSADTLAEDKVTKRQQSRIPGKAPSSRKPISERVRNGYQLYPRDVDSVAFHYYKHPTSGLLVMKIDSITGDQVYDSNASTPFPWHKKSATDLAARIAQAFSVYTREQSLYVMSEALKSDQRGK